jgi:hypothetical protein
MPVLPAVLMSLPKADQPDSQRHNCADRGADEQLIRQNIGKTTSDKRSPRHAGADYSQNAAQHPGGKKCAEENERRRSARAATESEYGDAKRGVRRLHRPRYSRFEALRHSAPLEANQTARITMPGQYCIRKSRSSGPSIMLPLGLAMIQCGPARAELTMSASNASVWMPQAQNQDRYHIHSQVSQRRRCRGREVDDGRRTQDIRNADAGRRTTATGFASLTAKNSTIYCTPVAFSLFHGFATLNLSLLRLCVDEAAPSAIGERLQFCTTFVGERKQQVDRLTLDQFPEFNKRLVWREKCLNNRTDRCFGLFNNGEAGLDAHLAYQSVDIDQGRNIRLVVRQGISVELGCLIDELLVKSLAPGFFLQKPFDSILMVLCEPS